MVHILGFLSSAEMIGIVVVALLVFGGAQIPKLARSLGRAQREFTSGLAEGANEADASGGSSKSTGSDSSGGGASGKNGSA